MLLSLLPSRSYGVLIWELVSGQDITEMQPLAIARQMHVRTPPPQHHHHQTDTHLVALSKRSTWGVRGVRAWVSC